MVLLWYHLDAIDADFTPVFVDKVQLETLFADIHFHSTLSIADMTLANHLLEGPGSRFNAEWAGIFYC